MQPVFRHREVADLAWCIGSPPLCSEPPDSHARWVSVSQCRDEWEALAPWFDALDDDPTALQRFLGERRSPRLGHYFEALTSFWLEHGPGLHRVAEAVVLKRDGQTLGELDFVYSREPENQPIHLEVAAKFYLRVDRAAQLSSYLGPGLRDRFDLKWRKLELEQSRRGLEPVAADTLGVALPCAEVRLKGVLFEPLGVEEALPAETAEGCLRGIWLRVSELEQVESKRRWHRLSKLEWLSGADPGAPGLSFGDLHAMLVDECPRPVQISECEDSVERARFFVVPNDFPARVS